ncbi:MAG: HNH endonuclease, partial [Candidatus Pacearchaeota archaeon]
SMGSTGYAFYCKTKIRLHQFIMGKKEGLVIDHINHDKLDNRKSNLRHVTFAQNCQNKKIKPIGISWHKKGKKWRAYYRENGITEHLGLFSNKLEAKRALSERKTVSRYNDRGLQIILKGSKVPL